MTEQDFKNRCLSDALMLHYWGHADIAFSDLIELCQMFIKETPYGETVTETDTSYKKEEYHACY